jgi:uncharacterized protein with WD repeat
MGNNGKLAPKQPESKSSSTSSLVAEDPKKAALEKQALGLKRKLRQIDQLKTKQSSGQQLEKNQLEKMTHEPQLLKELEAVERDLAKLNV